MIKNPKVALASLGCPKNQVDAEMLLANLKDDGFIITTDASQAEVIIVNTCGFIEDARRESLENIRDMAEYKKYGKLQALVVTGCLAERYKDEVSEIMDDVDLVVGIGKNKDIAKLCRNALNKKAQNAYGEKCDLVMEGNRILSTPPYTAYLRIADGCNNRCTYCAIPLIRGPYRSRKKEDIIKEAKDLATKGVKELVVIAQDTTYYGFDLYNKLALADLLKDLEKIEGIRWIRVLYAYPDFITDELIDVIKNSKKILHYLDIPLQHASGKVLADMNRRGDSKTLLTLIKKLRDNIPDITLRTTFIVGFPGETDADFETLCNFTKSAKFERMGAFTYSPEEDTKAAEFENQIDEDLKSRRLEILMDIQGQISEKIMCEKIGKTLDVVVEGYDNYDKRYFGRTVSDAPEIDGKVFFTSAKKLEAGQFVNVKIEENLEYDLLGKAE